MYTHACLIVVVRKRWLGPLLCAVLGILWFSYFPSSYRTGPAVWPRSYFVLAARRRWCVVLHLQIQRIRASDSVVLVAMRKRWLGRLLCAEHGLLARRTAATEPLLSYS
jgi:hypothetical protein